MAAVGIPIPLAAQDAAAMPAVMAIELRSLALADEVDEGEAAFTGDDPLRIHIAWP